MSAVFFSYTTWTQIKHLEKELDVDYTRILDVVLNEYWKQ